MAAASAAGGGQSAMDLSAAQFDPAVGWPDLEELRARWQGPLVVKGMLRAEDVARAASMGVDAVVLSNHGGRQLDRAVTPLDVLPDVRRVAGTLPILVDSGIRSGADIAIAIATGADAVLVGRPYLYGLGAAGEQGVAAVLRLLREELERTMALLGVTSVEQLRKEGPELLLR
jgi:L-lactate dehydrogenase (cytochrome)